MEEKLYKSGRNDLFSGILLSAFAAWYFVMATQIKIMKMLATTWLNASSVPKLWGGLLFLLGMILIVRGLRAMRCAKKNGYVPEKKTLSESWKAFRKANSQVILMFTALALFIALMNHLGFLISCFLFLFAQFNILQRKEDRKWLFSAILALVIAVLIYSLFRYAFLMPLPQGILKGIF